MYAHRLSDKRSTEKYLTLTEGKWFQPPKFPHFGQDFLSYAFSGNRLWIVWRSVKAGIEATRIIKNVFDMLKAIAGKRFVREHMDFHF